LVASGLPGSVAQTIASICSYEEAADQIERLKRAGAQLITILILFILSSLNRSMTRRSFFCPPDGTPGRHRLGVGTRRPRPTALRLRNGSLVNWLGLAWRSSRHGAGDRHRRPQGLSDRWR
jgi:hypothetical protein